MTNPIVKSFWDETTGSWQYVFHDPDTMQGAIVDPVLDFDPLSGSTATTNAERLLAYVRDAGIELVWILDTHPHADHFSAAVMRCKAQTVRRRAWREGRRACNALAAGITTTRYACRSLRC